MQSLNLPKFDLKAKGNQVFCQVRKKWIALTPEEWVRQHFLNLLISELDYPRGMMKLEHTIHYFKNIKRSDITVLNQGAGIFMLVECKAPTTEINQKVVNQISEYNKVLNANYLVVSNGLKHFIWEKSSSGLLQIQEFPPYGNSFIRL